MDLFNRDHADCLLSGIKKRPLVGGFLYTSTIVISIGATASVLYIEVFHWWGVRYGRFHCIQVIKNWMVERPWK